MWRADKKLDADGIPTAADDNSSAWGHQTAPEKAGRPLTNLSSESRVEPNRERWRDELSRVGGVSPLIHFDDSSRSRIELSATHPGGLAQFITGAKGDVRIKMRLGEKPNLQRDNDIRNRNLVMTSYCSFGLGVFDSRGWWGSLGNG